MQYLSSCKKCDSTNVSMKRGARQGVIYYIIVCENCGHSCGEPQRFPGDAINNWEHANHRDFYPCPSCGSEDFETKKDEYVVYIMCNNCGLETGRAESLEALQKIWNNNEGAKKRMMLIKDEEGGVNLE